MNEKTGGDQPTDRPAGLQAPGASDAAPASPDGTGGPELAAPQLQVQLHEQLAAAPGGQPMAPHEGAGTVEPWAAFMSADALERFLGLVESDLARRGWAFQRDGASGVVPLSDRSQLQIGLQRIAQLCHASPIERWGELIRAHFDVLGDPQRLLEETDALARDLDRALPLVRVRVQPEAIYTPEQWQQFIHRPLAEGLAATLVYDLPQQIVAVRRDHLSRFDLDEEALYRRARENLLAASDSAWHPIEVAPGVLLQSLELPQAPFFVASHLLLLERYVAPGPYGAIVFVPDRHTLLLHQIVDEGVLTVLERAPAPVRRVYDLGPGSISPYPYWWKDGTLTALPYTHDAGRPVLFIPPRFDQEVLAPIRAGAPASPPAPTERAEN